VALVTVLIIQENIFVLLIIIVFQGILRDLSISLLMLHSHLIKEAENK
jgi:hypothetical protein